MSPLALVALIPLVLNPLLSLAHEILPVSIPAIAHDLSSKPPRISGSLIAFSIEQDRWLDWAGYSSPNCYFRQLLSNLADINNVPFYLRIGANSQDRTFYNQNVSFVYTEFPAPNEVVPYPEARVIQVGDAYYEAVRFLPDNTHVTWGLNFRSNILKEALTQTDVILRTFALPEVRRKNIKLDSLELGNEANYWGYWHRPANWNHKMLTKQWIEWMTEVVQRPHFPPDLTLWAGSLAESAHHAKGWSPAALIADGIVDSYPGRFLTTMSQHHYSGSACAGGRKILADLINKSYIRSNVTIFESDIKASLDNGLEFIFGETNSYACHGAMDTSNAAAAALWALDYSLFSATSGISKVYFHEGIGFKYNFIQPISLSRSIQHGRALPSSLPPHIQPAYYAAVLSREAIGYESIIEELAIPDEHIAGYAFYDSVARDHLDFKAQQVLGKVGCEDPVKRLLLLNLEPYMRGDSSRAVKRIGLDIMTSPGCAQPTAVKVKRLRIPYANAGSGLTFAGQTYETEDGTLGGPIDVETVPIDGSQQPSLLLAATEAVVVYIDYT